MPSARRLSSSPATRVASPAPYVDGNRVFFYIDAGNGTVPCAISRLALEAFVGKRCFRAADLLSGFEKARPQIEDSAIRKWRERPDGISGRLNLWAEETDDPPSGGIAALSATLVNRV